MMDYTVGDTIRKCFTTRAFGTGIPTLLAGTPVLSVYEDGSITQITAGVSVTVSLDAVVGLNQLVIVATGANGFNAGSDYSVVITTGTVDSVSVVGETVYTFSLARSAAAVDLANATDGLGALRTLLLDIPTVAEFDARTLLAAGYFDPAADAVANVTLVATTTTNTDMRGTDSAALASVATEARLAELDAANVPANLDAVLVDTGTTLPARFTGIEGAAFATGTDSLEAIRDRGDAAWTTGAAGSGLTALAGGTAQGGTAATIQLAAGETFADSEPNGNIIKITGGTGNGQSRIIISYVGATDTATVSPNWTTTPDATSVYEMVNGSVNIAAVSNVAEDLATATELAVVDANVDAILLDTAEIGIAGAGLTNINLPNQTMDIVGNITGNLSGSVGSLTLNNDKTGYSISGTKTTLDALNDIVATAIVSAGAITTLSGAVVNVDSVDVNADMRGTDSAALASVCTEARLVELAAANMPADLDAVLLDTGTTLPAQIAALNNIAVSDILTTQMTEVYAADGVAPTLAQALFLIQQMLGDFSITGTALTVRRIDGATTAAIFTLDSATAPTDITRVS